MYEAFPKPRAKNAACFGKVKQAAIPARQTKPREGAAFVFTAFLSQTRSTAPFPAHAVWEPKNPAPAWLPWNACKHSLGRGASEMQFDCVYYTRVRAGFQFFFHMSRKKSGPAGAGPRKAMLLFLFYVRSAAIAAQPAKKLQQSAAIKIEAHDSDLLRSDFVSRGRVYHTSFVG